MDLNNKNYYNQLFKDEIFKVSKLDKKPTLLLHACCGPCLTYPLSILIDKFDITVCYINPNIRPVDEYNRRLQTLKRFVDEYSKDRNIKVNLYIANDDFTLYDNLFKDRYSDVEGGNTCLRCHRYRMNLSYKYASENNFDYFTTVMSVSSKKPSREINQIGEQLQKDYPNTKYLFSDFKKDDGQLKGILLSKQYKMYRQDYCGCLPSLQERDNRKQKQNSEILVG